MIDVGELKVPRALRPIVEEIVGVTDEVCLNVLDEEYADLARRAAGKLARKRPSPLSGGRRATWAAGIVYALGQASGPARSPVPRPTALALPAVMARAGEGHPTVLNGSRTLC